MLTTNANNQISVESLLNSYYGRNTYAITNSIDYQIDSNDYVIKKVTNKNDAKNIGYVVLDKNKSKPIYFVDIDIIRRTVIAQNLIDNTSVQLENFNSDLLFQQDFLKSLKESQTPKTTHDVGPTNPGLQIPIGNGNGRFWGWSCGNEFLTNPLDPNSCAVSCTHYVLGIPGSPDIYSCNSKQADKARDSGHYGG